VVSHLGPDQDSQLDEILARVTKLRVVEAKDGDRLDPDHVYVPARSAALGMKDGCLVLHRTEGERVHKPVDIFFNRFGQDVHERAVGDRAVGLG